MTSVTVACDKPDTPSSEGSKPDVAVPDGGSGAVGGERHGTVLHAKARGEGRDTDRLPYPIVVDQRSALPTAYKIGGYALLETR